MNLNLVPSKLRRGEISPRDRDKDKNLLGTLDTCRCGMHAVTVSRCSEFYSFDVKSMVEIV